MSKTIDLCNHLNEIIDENRGDIICTDCGLVLSDKLFINYKGNEENKNTSIDGNEINEYLEKLNLPTCFSSKILDNYKKTRNGKRKKKELLPYTIYKCLNDEGFPISMKEISAVSGFTDSKLYSMQEEAIILKPCQLLEKYCKILGLDYSTYRVIKTALPTSKLTGHNPLTIVGSVLYAYLKKHKPRKFPMKTIAKVVNTSCISIQRYLKNNELSFWL